MNPEQPPLPLTDKETLRISDIVATWEAKEIQQVLFVCTANFQRSKTCEDIFKKATKHISVKSAGVSKKECNRRGTTLCTDALLDEADIIYIFETLHSKRINEHTSFRFNTKLINLDIPDHYSYMSPAFLELVLFKLQALPKWR